MASTWIIGAVSLIAGLLLIAFRTKVAELNRRGNSHIAEGGLTEADYPHGQDVPGAVVAGAGLALFGVAMLVWALVES